MWYLDVQLHYRRAFKKDEGLSVCSEWVWSLTVNIVPGGITKWPLWHEYVMS